MQAVFLLIGKTSALTMNIAGVIKDWMLIFFSFYLFHAPVTALNLLGYAFCCTGVRAAHVLLCLMRPLLLLVAFIRWLKLTSCAWEPPSFHLLTVVTLTSDIEPISSTSAASMKCKVALWSVFIMHK